MSSEKIQFFTQHPLSTLLNPEAHPTFLSKLSFTSDIQTYIEIDYLTTIYDRFYDELSPFSQKDLSLNNLEKNASIQDIQLYAKQILVVQKADKKVKWYREQSKSLAKTEFQNKLLAIALKNDEILFFTEEEMRIQCQIENTNVTQLDTIPSYHEFASLEPVSLIFSNQKKHEVQTEININYIKQQLHNYNLHREFAHFPSSALASLANKLRDLIAYLENALGELDNFYRKNKKLLSQPPHENNYTQIKELLLTEKKRQEIRLTALHEAIIARLQCASRNKNVNNDDVMSDFIQTLKEQKCLTETMNLPYKRRDLSQRIFMQFHHEIWMHATLEIKRKMLNLYWLQPQSEAAIPTVVQTNSLFPLPISLAPACVTKPLPVRFWNRGYQLRYRATQNIIFYAAKINGLFEKLNFSLIFSPEHKTGEMDFFNLFQNSTFKLLKKVESTLEDEINYYHKHIKKHKNSWFLSQSKKFLNEAKALFQAVQENKLSDCYLKFSSVILNELTCRLSKHRHATLLAPQEIENIKHMLSTIKQKLFTYESIIVFTQNEENIMGLLNLNKATLLGKLERGEMISKFEKNHWLPKEEEIAEQDNQIRIELAESAIRGLRKLQSSALSFDEKGNKRIQQLKRLIKLINQLTFTAREYLLFSPNGKAQKELVKLWQEAINLIQDDYTLYLKLLETAHAADFEKKGNYQSALSAYKQMLSQDKLVQNEIKEIVFCFEKDDYIGVSVLAGGAHYARKQDFLRAKQEGSQQLRKFYRKMKELLLFSLNFSEDKYQLFKKKSKSILSEDGFFPFQSKYRSFLTTSERMHQIFLLLSVEAAHAKACLKTLNTGRRDEVTTIMQDFDRKVKILLRNDEVATHRESLLNSYSLLFFEKQGENKNENHTQRVSKRHSND